MRRPESAPPIPELGRLVQTVSDRAWDAVGGGDRVFLYEDNLEFTDLGDNQVRFRAKLKAEYRRSWKKWMMVFERFVYDRLMPAEQALVDNSPDPFAKIHQYRSRLFP